MSEIKLLGIFFVTSVLCGCAAVSGAHGDAAVAKQTAAAQAAAGQQPAGVDLNAETITPPTLPPTPAENATTNASKIIAPLH